MALARFARTLSTLLVEEFWSLEYAPQPDGSHRLVRLHVGGGAPKPLVRMRERQLTRLQAGPRRSSGSGKRVDLSF